MCTLWTAIVAAELASQNRSACFGVKNYDFTKIRDICNSWKRNTAVCPLQGKYTFVIPFWARVYSYAGINGSNSVLNTFVTYIYTHKCCHF